MPVRGRQLPPRLSPRGRLHQRGCLPQRGRPPASEGVVPAASAGPEKAPTSALPYYDASRLEKGYRFKGTYKDGMKEFLAAVLQRSFTLHDPNNSAPHFRRVPNPMRRSFWVTCRIEGCTFRRREHAFLCGPFSRSLSSATATPRSRELQNMSGFYAAAIVTDITLCGKTVAEVRRTVYDPSGVSSAS